jgi:release factor glutamine methyltransferase
VDISAAALDVARGNIHRFGLQARVKLLLADLLEAAPDTFDLICANLPYIPTATLNGLSVTDFEPRLALDGGADGLRLIERLLGQLPSYLAHGGLALLEIEAGQGNSALDLTAITLPGWPARVLSDLAGLPRLLRIESPEI